MTLFSKHIAALCLLIAGNAAVLADDFNPDLPPEPQTQYRVSVGVADTKGATVSGEGWYTTGQQVRIACYLKTNYKFRYWTLNGDSCSNQTSFYYTITNKAAEFMAYVQYEEPTIVTPPEDTVIVVPDPPFDPSLPSEPTTSTDVYVSRIFLSCVPVSAGYFSATSGTAYTEGSQVSLCAYANENYVLEGWYKNGERISQQECIDVTVPLKDLSLVAQYRLVENPVYRSQLYVRTNLTGACTFNITSGNTYVEGSSVLLTRTTTSKHEWLGWYIGETLISTDSMIVYTTGRNDATIWAMYREVFDPSVPSDPTTNGGDIDNRPTTMITAPFKPGWVFDHWSDGVTNNPRSVIVGEEDLYTPVYLPADYLVNLRKDICQGDYVSFAGQQLTTEGVYRDTLKATNTADSIIVLALYVHSPYELTSSQTIYLGDSIYFGGAWRSTSGTYQDAHYSIYGCDSIHYLNLSVVDTTRYYSLIVLSADSSIGRVTGSGRIVANQMAKLTATGFEGYRFYQWNDGNQDNPRSVVVTRDTTFTAYFVPLKPVADSVVVSDEQPLSLLPVGDKTHIIVRETGRLVVDQPALAASLTLWQSDKAAAEVVNIQDLTVASADMVLRLETDTDEAEAAKWYAFGVPFAVALSNGIRQEGDSANATVDYDFFIDAYNGSQRTSYLQGWDFCSATDVLQPGRFYRIGVNSNANLWRFTKQADVALHEQTAVTVSTLASVYANNSGWNGISNTTLQAAYASMQGLRYATVYHNTTSTYETVLLNQTPMPASCPFLVQAAGNGSVMLSPTAGDDTPVYTICLANENFTDKAYLTASEMKENEYTIGVDVEKMTTTNTSVPQLWWENYGVQLAAHEAPLMGNTAVVLLGLYAPHDGVYTLSTSSSLALYYYSIRQTPVIDQSTATATWQLYLNEGTCYYYSIKVGDSSIVTDLQPHHSPLERFTKRLMNGQLLLIRDGKAYNAVGAEVK